MKKAMLLALAIVSSALLAACTGGGAGSSLTGGTWYLTSGTQTAPAWQWAVPPGEQASYTITFNSDGNFSANADCNVAGGTYETSGTDGLTITPDTSTHGLLRRRLAGHPVCPRAEHDDNLQDRQRRAHADAGRRRDADVHVDQVDGSAEPEASPEEVPVGSAGDQGLTGAEWSLVAITEEVPAFQGVVPPDEQQNYQIAFTEDGTFSAKADCNQVSGEYETEDAAASSGPLTITPGPSTLAFCPEGSLGDLFVIGLSNTVSYEITADGLVLTLGNGGTLQFRSCTPSGGPVASTRRDLDQSSRTPCRRSSAWTRPTSSRSNGSSCRTESAAATPAPWPLTVQHIMFRVDACETLSPPIDRPATIRLPTSFGTSDGRAPGSSARSSAGSRIP